MTHQTPIPSSEKANTMQSICLEIVRWKSKHAVEDQAMIEAMKGIETDLATCKGFIKQTLHKTSDNEWVDTYYWETEATAHASNEYMADKPSFIHLMSLIDVPSVSIETMMSVAL